LWNGARAAPPWHEQHFQRGRARKFRFPVLRSNSACNANRAIALLEFVNMACRIDKFLLTAEEGMAGGADAEWKVSYM